MCSSSPPLQESWTLTLTQTTSRGSEDDSDIEDTASPAGAVLAVFVPETFQVNLVPRDEKVAVDHFAEFNRQSQEWKGGRGLRSRVGGPRERHACISTSILRVSRQVSAETLDVLYGENNFVFEKFCEPSAPIVHFSRANLMRLRILSIEHPCIMRGLDVDPQYENGSDWGASSIASGDADSGAESDGGYFLGDDPALLDVGRERMLAPEQTRYFQAHIWRPLFRNITNLTLILTVRCCNSPNLLDDSIVNDMEEIRDYAIKRAFRYYNNGLLAPTAVVHRRVRCSDHKCFCAVRKKKCNRIQRFINELWVGDSEAGKSTEA